MKEYDAIVIGAGIIGASCAYYLSKKGLKVAVVEKAYPATGASGACNGGLSCFGKSGEQLENAYQSLIMYKNLENELETPLEISQDEKLVLIVDSKEKAYHLEKSIDEISHLGINARLMNKENLASIFKGEKVPYAAAEILDGLHGWTNPFSIVNAYLDGLLKNGGGIYKNWCASDILMQNRAVYGLTNGTEMILSPVVINCGGVDAAYVWDSLGIDIEILSNRGIVLVTEQTPWEERSKFLSADFWSEDTNRVTLAIEQTIDGNLLIGSSRELGNKSSDIDLEIIMAIANNAISYFPKLKDVSVIRAFTGFRPYRKEGPFLGKINGYEGLYAAVGFGGTGITMAPWAGSTLAGMITN